MSAPEPVRAVRLSRNWLVTIDERPAAPRRRELAAAGIDAHYRFRCGSLELRLAYVPDDLHSALRSVLELALKELQ